LCPKENLNKIQANTELLESSDTLRMELGFDNVVTSLEGLAWRLEQIGWAQPLRRLATDHRSPAARTFGSNLIMDVIG
jgi:hypothetical protein